MLGVCRDVCRGELERVDNWFVRDKIVKVVLAKSLLASIVIAKRVC